MGDNIFWFRQNLCPWRPFKLGTPHLVLHFGEPFFQTPIICAWNELFGHFKGSKQLTGCWLSDGQIFEFRPNLCLWQLFKEGNRQGILADFAMPFFKPPLLGPRMDFLDIFCAHNDYPVIGYLCQPPISRLMSRLSQIITWEDSHFFSSSAARKFINYC